MSRVCIVCDGEFPSGEYPLYLLESADRVVCCDGALEKILQWGRREPDAVVGDMDTLPEALSRKYSHIIHKVDEQDYNDLVKAMRFVLATWPDTLQIDILGASGMREDHTIGNYGLLMDFPRILPLGDISVEMVSDYGTAFCVTDSCELHLGEGRRISLFSADNTLSLHSEGLEWPTDGVVFDAWWKATLNRTSAPVIKLSFSHPSRLLVIID